MRIHVKNTFKSLSIVIICTAALDLLGCSCEGNPELNVDSKFTYDIVFTGTVLAIDSVELITTFAASDNYREIMQEMKAIDSTLSQLLVRRVKIAKCLLYQGNLDADTITVFTPVKGASCGFTDFRVGDDYIVDGFSDNMLLKSFNIGQDYHYKPKNTVWTHQCTRTSRILIDDHAIIEEIFDRRLSEILTIATTRIYHEEIVSDKKYLTVRYTPNENNYNWIGGENKLIKAEATTNFKKADVVFRKIIYKDNGFVIVLFNSKDIGGYKYSGEVQLSMNDDGKMLYKKIYYISSID